MLDGLLPCVSIFDDSCFCPSLPTHKRIRTLFFCIFPLWSRWPHSTAHTSKPSFWCLQFEMMVDDYMRKRNDGTMWENNEPVLNSTRRDEILESMFQEIDDIDQGRKPKPEDWPISWEEEQRLAGIDPHAPCTPSQVMVHRRRRILVHLDRT